MNTSHVGFLLFSLATSLVGCAGSSDENADNGAQDVVSGTLDPKHGLSGPIAAVANDGYIYASIHEGGCELTVVDTLAANEGRGNLYTKNGNVGPAKLIIGEGTITLETDVTPVECDAVVTPGKAYRTTKQLDPNLIGFRTVIADKSFFVNESGQRLHNSPYVIGGQTIRVFKGAAPPGLTNATYDATKGFLPASDLSSDVPLSDGEGR